MTPARVDPTLQVPAAPARVARLGEVPPALELAGSAGDAPFAVEGEAASALGIERGPVAWIRIGGRVVASHLGVVGGSVVNVLASPGLLRRERLGDGLYVNESLLAAPTLPLVVYQVSRPPADTISDDVVLGFTLLPGARSIRYRTTDDVLVAVDDDDADRVVVAALVPAPDRQVVEEVPGGGLSVRAYLSRDAETTLLLAAGPHDRVRTALAAGAHLAAHERRAGAPPDGGLVVDSGVTDLDEGVAWARARAVASLHRPDLALAFEPVVYAGLGALAGGDLDAARAAVAVIEELPIPDDPLPLLFAGRFALATGDTRPAERQLEGLADRTIAGPRALCVRAFLTLADSLAQAAPEDAVAALRDRARAAHRPAGGPMTLPMAGQAPAEPPDPTDHLAWLLGDHLQPAPAGAPPGELAAWSDMRRGDVDAGWQRWRADLGKGLRPGVLGRGSWDDATAGVGAPRAGIHLTTLVHGLLGWEPDAPMSRATLAPALPGHLTRFAVRGLGVGDVRMDLAYRRDGATITFELTPTAGRSPPMLVFAARVPGGVDAVHLDGGRAEVDTKAVAGGTRVPFQFPLDRPRRVRIDLTGA